MGEKTTETETESKTARLGNKIKFFASNITVEPIVFCNFLALSFFRVTEHAGLYEVICYQNYHKDYDVNCKKLKSYPKIEDMVQQDASVINMYLSLAYLLPAIASDIFLGAWSDRYGRKVNILVGLTGLIVAAFPNAIIFTYPQTSLMLLVVAHIIAGTTGYIAIIMISSLAYLTDIVPDKSKLTIRMARVFVCNSAAQAIGSFAVGALLKVTSYAYVILLTEIILSVAFVYTYFRIKHIPPVELRKKVAAKKNGTKLVVKKPVVPAEKSDKEIIDKQQTDKENIDKQQEASSTGCLNEIAINFKFIGKMYKEVWHTLTRIRSGHRRGYIYLMTLVYLLFFISELGLLHGPVLSLYVFRRPFEWKPSDLAFFKGTQAVLVMVGHMFGSLFMKKFLKFKETTVMLICLVSGFAHMLMIAFATTSWLLYLSLLIGMLVNLTIPTMKSYIAQLVEVDEVGKVFTANGVTADLAFVLSTLLFNNIYSATVKFFPGFVFVFAAGLMLVCFLIVLAVHIDEIKTDDKMKTDDKKEKEVKPLPDKTLVIRM